MRCKFGFGKKDSLKRKISIFDTKYYNIYLVSIQNALANCSAIDLFQFGREELEIICGGNGKEEVGKLYSLLLAAKNRCNVRLLNLNKNIKLKNFLLTM
jgi:hypothetical protein